MVIRLISVVFAEKHCLLLPNSAMTGTAASHEEYPKHHLKKANKQNNK